MTAANVAILESMENVGDATVIFVVHFVALFVEHKTLIRALINYFDTEPAPIASSNAFLAYLEILRIQPYPCKLEDGQND
jgi:hypothetical protein